MTNFTKEMLDRLNDLIQDPDVRMDISRLLETRIPVSTATANHPTLQVCSETLGALGLINGIVGVISEGPKAGYGYITAVYDDDGGLIRFEETDQTKV